MSKTLRVLNVEDSELDATLLNRHLSRAGYELVFNRVETAASLKAALDQREWDIILTDYSLPQFGALQALALIRGLGFDTPVIVISGTIGEQLAVEAMLAGANDYLMKANLTRLVPAIEREMEEARNRQARKQAERALRTSESELRALFDAMTDVIQVLDIHGRYLKVGHVDPAHSNGISGNLEGKTLQEVLPFDKAELFLAHIRTAVQSQRRQRVEYALESEGSVCWYDGSVAPMSDDSAVWIARDITERKRSEHALKESEERYRLLFQGNPHAMYVFDEETLGFLAVNESAIQKYGYSVDEFLSMSINDIQQPDATQGLTEALSKWPGGEHSAITKHKKKDGSVVDVEITDHRFLFMGRRAFLVLAHDITERRMLEEQLRQAQKMEAIGQLAGGIAHDFNNLLTVIAGYSELALEQLRAGTTLRDYIEEVKKAGQTAASLSRQLLAFSRKQVLRPTVLNLNAVVSESEKMLQRVIGEDIELKTVLEADIGNIKADPGQIEQVIMNLAVNARDAMPSGGKLTIETSNVDLGADYSRHHVSVNAGSYVMLAVSDTGVGMDAQTQARIFEPFFTTKDVGKGTGLGLSTVYGIVKQSGGSIWVYSELGRGTAFKIYLPRVDEGAEAYRRSDDAAAALRGTETILLTEDDEMVRKLARTMLENYGYHVLDASDGPASLGVCRTYAGRIHLLITDVVMPAMNGRDLARQAVEMRPEMKVLFMSGYTSNAVSLQKMLEDKTPFIQKPFSPGALAQRVREVLKARVSRHESA